MEYTIGHLKKKRDIMTEDVNGLYAGIVEHKKSIEKKEGRIPILMSQLKALDKAIAILEKEQEKEFT